MFFIPYQWKHGEFESLISNNNSRNECFEENNNEMTRFGGLVLPFIGGLLVGGLFMPRPNFNNQMLPPQYAQPIPPMYVPQQNYYYTPR